ncbi:MAG: hypothetical protein HRU38_18385 [Saccharospirillaceae bacterium]|nr:hypothetical protein [Pseudomonadales bacterium]NRB80606.1 hypothetical protein [Saccharospirillaceae bacterium]
MGKFKQFKQTSKQWIIDQSIRTGDNFALLVKGSYLFTLGMMVMIWTNKLAEPSLQAELITLSGLIVLIFGIIVSLRGYMALSLFRILRYFLEE